MKGKIILLVVVETTKNIELLILLVLVASTPVSWKNISICVGIFHIKLVEYAWVTPFCLKNEVTNIWSVLYSCDFREQLFLTVKNLWPEKEYELIGFKIVELTKSCIRFKIFVIFHVKDYRLKYNLTFRIIINFFIKKSKITAVFGCLLKW